MVVNIKNTLKEFNQEIDEYASLLLRSLTNRNLTKDELYNVRNEIIKLQKYKDEFYSHIHIKKRKQTLMTPAKRGFFRISIGKKT